MTIVLRMPDGVPLTAQQERQAWGAVHGGGSGRQLGGRSGFRVGTPSNVLSATSTTWTLGACSAMLDPGAQTHQGMYGWSNDSNVTGTMRPANSTYSRKDIVYIQVNDSDMDTSGAKSAPVLYAYGPEDGTNALPPLPPRSFLVGTISVPIAGGGSPTVQLNTARYVAAGAPLPVSSQAERDALTTYDGLTVRRLDVAGRPLETYDGAQWLPSRISTIWTNASSMVPTSGGGPGVLSLDAGNSQNPSFITSPGAGQIQVALAGTYSFTWHANSLAGTSGYMSVKNQNGTGTYVLTNFPPSGEQSVSIPNLDLAAGAVVSFVMGPSSQVTIGSTIRVTKVA